MLALPLLSFNLEGSHLSNPVMTRLDPDGSVQVRKEWRHENAPGVHLNNNINPETYILPS